MKIFLSCPISSKVDSATGEVSPIYRRKIESILTTIRSAGHSVFADIEDANWKIGLEPPVQAVRLIIEQIVQSDILLALLEDRPSAGVQWEIGYANALKIPVYIAVIDGSKPAFWNEGLVGLSLIHRIEYDAINGFEQSLATLDNSPVAVN